MMTSDKKGVECDLCGTIYNTKFIYFSCIITKVDVDIKNGQIIPEDRHLDMDWCDKCMGKFKSYMLKVIDIREGRAAKEEKTKAGEWSLE
jgi:hypothetical protein